MTHTPKNLSVIHFIERLTLSPHSPRLNSIDPIVRYFPLKHNDRLEGTDSKKRSDEKSLDRISPIMSSKMGDHDDSDSDSVCSGPLTEKELKKASRIVREKRAKREEQQEAPVRFSMRLRSKAGTGSSEDMTSEQLFDVTLPPPSKPVKKRGRKPKSDTAKAVSESVKENDAPIEDPPTAPVSRKVTRQYAKLLVVSNEDLSEKLEEEPEPRKTRQTRSTVDAVKPKTRGRRNAAKSVALLVESTQDLDRDGVELDSVEAVVIESETVEELVVEETEEEEEDRNLEKEAIVMIETLQISISETPSMHETVQETLEEEVEAPQPAEQEGESAEREDDEVSESDSTSTPRSNEADQAKRVSASMEALYGSVPEVNNTENDEMVEPSDSEEVAQEDTELEAEKVQQAEELIVESINTSSIVAEDFVESAPEADEVEQAEEIVESMSTSSTEVENCVEPAPEFDEVEQAEEIVESINTSPTEVENCVEPAPEFDEVEQAEELTVESMSTSSTEVENCVEPAPEADEIEQAEELIVESVHTSSIMAENNIEPASCDVELNLDNTMEEDMEIEEDVFTTEPEQVNVPDFSLEEAHFSGCNLSGLNLSFESGVSDPLAADQSLGEEDGDSQKDQDAQSSHTNLYTLACISECAKKLTISPRSSVPQDTISCATPANSPAKRISKSAPQVTSPFITSVALGSTAATPANSPAKRVSTFSSGEPMVTPAAIFASPAGTSAKRVSTYTTQGSMLGTPAVNSGTPVGTSAKKASTYFNQEISGSAVVKPDTPARFCATPAGTPAKRASTYFNQEIGSLTKSNTPKFTAARLDTPTKRISTSSSQEMGGPAEVKPATPAIALAGTPAKRVSYITRGSISSPAVQIGRAASATPRATLVTRVSSPNSRAALSGGRRVSQSPRASPSPARVSCERASPRSVKPLTAATPSPAAAGGSVKRASSVRASVAAAETTPLETKKHSFSRLYSPISPADTSAQFVDAVDKSLLLSGQGDVAESTSPGPVQFGMVNMVVVSADSDESAETTFASAVTHLEEARDTMNNTKAAEDSVEATFSSAITQQESSLQHDSLCSTGDLVADVSSELSVSQGEGSFMNDTFDEIDMILSMGVGNLETEDTALPPAAAPQTEVKQSPPQESMELRASRKFFPTPHLKSCPQVPAAEKRGSAVKSTPAPVSSVAAQQKKKLFQTPKMMKTPANAKTSSEKSVSAGASSKAAAPALRAIKTPATARISNEKSSSAGAAGRVDTASKVHSRTPFRVPKTAEPMRAFKLPASSRIPKPMRSLAHITSPVSQYIKAPAGAPRFNVVRPKSPLPPPRGLLCKLPQSKLAKPQQQLVGETENMNPKTPPVNLPKVNYDTGSSIKVVEHMESKQKPLPNNIKRLMPSPGAVLRHTGRVNIPETADGRQEVSILVSHDAMRR